MFVITKKDIAFYTIISLTILLAIFTPITFTNQAVRQLIECIRVMSKNEIQIIYKGGLERDVKLE